MLAEIEVNGLHAGVCSRALLIEALASEHQIGPKRAYNALVLAGALSSPASAVHDELLVATIVQLCAPLREEAACQVLTRGLERASSTVKRALDRLIMTSSDRRVRDRLIPMLSIPAMRRPARACLESCIPGVIDSACASGGHRLKIKGRLALLCNSAIALQFHKGLRNESPFGERASSILFECLLQGQLSSEDLSEDLM